MASHVTVISKDNKVIVLDMFSFVDGLNFARSFNKRQYDKENKVWNVGYVATEIQEEIEYQTAYNEIYEIMQKCNSVYGSEVAYSNWDKRAAMTPKDVDYWTKQLLQNPDSFCEIELEIVGAIDNHIVNYR